MQHQRARWNCAAPPPRIVGTPAGAALGWHLVVGREFVAIAPCTVSPPDLFMARAYDRQVP